MAPRLRTFGNALRDLRHARTWSQEQLAEIAGVNVRTVQRLEAGGSASLETRRALAAVLDVTVEAVTSPSSGIAMSAPSSSLRIDRIAVIVLLGALLGLAQLMFGYVVGKDAALRDNQRDCIAAGVSDCR